MKKLLIGLFTLLCFVALKSSVFAADSKAMLNFERVELLPKDSLVAVPIYLNTQGKELNSLQLKVDVNGEIKDLGVTIGSEMPVQEITKQITDKSIFVSLTSLELGKGWSTTEDVELLKISFQHVGEGEVGLSFDKKETLAGSNESDENVLTMGEDLTVKIGEIVPIMEKQIEEEIDPSISQAKMENEPANEEAFVKTNNNLLIGLIAGSFAIVIALLIYILKNQKKDKSEESKLPLS